MRAFDSIAAATRQSVIEVRIADETVAFGAVIDRDGFALTKASELKEGGIACRLADGRSISATVAAVDDENDVALLELGARDLQPIQWTQGTAALGQWAITPGLDESVEAIGIVSAPLRKIPPPRALIGVQLDFNSSSARIGQVMPGLGAEKAGLQRDDVILSVNSEPVSSGEELISKLRTFREGQTVHLSIRREEEIIEVDIKMTVPKREESPFGPDRQERLNRLGGDLSERSEGFNLAIQHDTVLQPWQCGGPLIDVNGKAIGLNIARAGRVASYALPSPLVLEIIDRLKSQRQKAVTHDPSKSPQ